MNYEDRLLPRIARENECKKARVHKTDTSDIRLELLAITKIKPRNHPGIYLGVDNET